jgi:hypothetical protein
MKTIVLRNTDSSVRVEYLTDLIGKNQELTVYTQNGTPNGLSETEIALGLDLGVDEYNVKDVEALSEEKELFMEIYENGQDSFLFTPQTLPDGSNGVGYDKTITPSGGVGDKVMEELTGTDLVAGLSFNNATGQVSGTPSATGTCKLIVKATDENGVSIICAYKFEIA